VVDYLLAHHVDVNARDAEQATPLHYAAMEAISSSSCISRFVTAREIHTHGRTKPATMTKMGT
jgi:hypothetical protein